MYLKLTEKDKDLIARGWVRFNSDPNTPVILKERLPEPNYKKTLTLDGDIWSYEDNPEDILTFMGFRDPDSVFEIILKIADLTDDPWLLELLATGPVESLIKHHDNADRYFTQYKKLAATNTKHAKILSMVWL